MFMIHVILRVASSSSYIHTPIFLRYLALSWVKREKIAEKRQNTRKTGAHGMDSVNWGRPLRITVINHKKQKISKMMKRCKF